MAKRLKLRICKAITTTLQSCRSKNPSNLPTNPVPSFSPSQLISTAHHYQPPSHHLGHDDEDHQFKWQKEDNWHVVVAKVHHQPRRKIYTSSASTSPTPPPQEETKTQKHKKKKNKNKNNKKRNYKNRIRVSTSSGDSGWFSSEEYETETLVSSLSTDSSSLKLHSIKESQPFITNIPHRRRNRGKRGGVVAAAAAEGEVMPARLSVFQKMIPCAVEGKVKESFAIVKRSKDPYEDFKNSMMDMILEKQMFEPEDLEQLLQCFLSLNSRIYHGVIVDAFSEIWESIFSS